MIPFGCEARRGDGTVEAKRCVLELGVHILDVRLDDVGAGTFEWSAKQAREFRADCAVRFCVEFRPHLRLFRRHRTCWDAKVRMEAGGQKLNLCAGRVAGCVYEGVNWKGFSVCEVDGLSGQMMDILPMYLDLPRANESIEVSRVIVGSRGCAVPKGTSKIS
jgi:hypothetical protein